MGFDIVTDDIAVAGVSAVDRRALRAVAVQFFVNGAVVGSIFTRLPEIRDQLAVTVATLGTVLTAAGVAGLLGSAITSRTIARLSTRRVLVVGAATQVALLLLVGFSGHVVVFALAMAGIMFVDVLVDVSMNLQASWLSGRRRVPVMNRLHGLWSFGGLIGGLAASASAASGISLRYHLIGSTLVLLLALIYVRQGLLQTDEAPSRQPQLSAKRRVNPRPAAITLTLFAIAGAASIVVEQTSADWSALRLSDDLDAGAGAAGLAFASFTAGMTIGRFCGDALQVALGRNRLFYSSCAVALTGVATSAFAPVTTLAWAGYLIGGLGIATFFPMLYDDAAQTPGKTGATLSAMSAGARTAGLATPVLVGALAATSLGVGEAVAIVAIPALVVLPVTRWLLDN